MSRSASTLAMYAALIFGPSIAVAYEVDTHALITSAAYDRSVLPSAELSQRLGLDRLDQVQPFHVPETIPNFTANRDAYHDVQSGGWTTPNQFFSIDRRNVQVYDRSQMPGIYRGIAASANQFQARAWLMRGAVREDDLRKKDYEEGELTPDPDPFGEIVRVYHHFFDPVHGNGLSAPCSALPGGIAEGCVPSPDWAMGRTGATELAPDPVNGARRNHFTWVDAREALMCALIYKRWPNDQSLNSAERRLCMATTFVALGHVSHLLQDTAQPQHVRDDAHNPPDGTVKDAFSTDQARRTYEIWSNFRATAGQDVSSPGFEKEQFREIFQKTTAKPLLTTAPYPIPQFSAPVKFFSTRQIESTTDVAAVAQRRGLADFTNRNFFSEGTVLSSNFLLPPPNDQDMSYVLQPLPTRVIPGVGNVTERELRHAVTDPVAGSYTDPLSNTGGLIPLAKESMWYGHGLGKRVTSITLDQYTAHADILVPRAVAYTAGIINHFFRGKLEITAPADRIIGVVNQGESHAMVAGYPRKTSNNAILGFEKIRVKVRNATDAVVESGTGTGFPQYLGAAGSYQGKLIAIARYHRNSCYKPDLSGERVQSYAAPPGLVIVNPTCGADSVRTGYEEISVSAPLTITAPDVDSASELDNLASGTGVEKVFDFSADPIPVNATDLFIQVVYRGRMGKEHDAQNRANNAEPDAIAIGTFDVREPTYASFWNNTDWFWSVGANPPQWLAWNVALYPHSNVQSFWICAGGAPVKLVYEDFGAPGAQALNDPVVNGTVPGSVRVALLFPPPSFPGQLFNVRGTPVVPSGDMALLPRSLTVGAFIHQANKDQVADSTLADPKINCGSGLPPQAEYWCSDPVQKRRSRVFGSVASPIYRDTGFGATADDVDAQPLPVFAGNQVLGAGTVRFNVDSTLQACPSAPSAPQSRAAQLYQELMELREQANEMGISEEQ